MRRVAYSAAAVAFLACAGAQEPDPALDGLGAAPEGPSELDILSKGADSDFPDIGSVAQREPVSVTLRALNKVTAKYTDIVVNMNETARYGSLELTPRFCDKRPPEEFPETTAFLEIVDIGGARKSDIKPDGPLAAEAHSSGAQDASGALEEAGAQGEGNLQAAQTTPAPGDATQPDARKLPANMIFSGWMFASSPALNGLEHPVYDVWVIDCKTVSIDN
ncbi:MAG: DUF2155 domain-containing protein [Parvularculaceae bacterium]|nr:DUF2155 domain-containing protein [Parvularculaceae bacterium]